MATQNFEALRRNVEALGFQLFMDCSLEESDQVPRRATSPRLYVHDPWTDRHVVVGTHLDVEGWLAWREAEPKADSDANAKVLRILDDLFNSVRYARGAIRVLGETDLRPYQHDAVDAIHDRLLIAQNLIDALHEWRGLVASLAPHGQPEMQDVITAEIREEYPNASRR